MPSHALHRWFNRLITGREHDDVNKFCDLVRGRGHRCKWGHNWYTPLLVYMLTRNRDKAIAAAAHILLDELEKKLKYGKR